MKIESAGRAAVLMCLISFFQGFCFYAPVATLYRTSVGVTLTQVALIESVNYILVVALEVPMGAVCARLGYKWMLVLVNGMFFLSKLVFWQAYTFGMFLLERVMLAAVTAGFSGCDDAYLYLAAGPQRAQEVFGLYSACGTAGLVLSSAVFSAFFSADYRGAALWTALFYGAAALCALLLPPVPRTAADRGSFQKQLVGIVENLREDPRFLLVLGSDVLLSITGQTVTVFLAQLLYVRRGIPQQWLGVLYVMMTLCALSAGASHWVRSRMGRHFAPGVFLLGAVGCLAAGLTRTPVLCVAGVFSLQFAWRVWEPYSAKLRNDNVRGGSRSVILSGYSMAQNLATGGLSLALGALADLWLTAALLAAGGLAALGAALIGLWQNGSMK